MEQHTSEEGGLTIQEMAQAVGLSVHTLRYYERIGLIAPVGRDHGNGHRRYSDEDVQRISFLLKLRATGMPVRVMQRFVALYLQGDDTLPERQRILEDHYCAVRARIEELQQNLGVIEYKIALYAQQAEGNGKGNDNQC
ncbi:MAG: MerR family transcriptional regulator [Armatimonadaceae bacterium]